MNADRMSDRIENAHWRLINTAKDLAVEGYTARELVTLQFATALATAMALEMSFEEFMEQADKMTNQAEEELS